VCPPVVEYDRAFLARAADELEALPEGSAIEQMLSDYAVMREQARACSWPPTADFPSVLNRLAPGGERSRAIQAGFEVRDRKRLPGGRRRREIPP
jgi:hypothetical protein